MTLTTVPALELIEMQRTSHDEENSVSVSLTKKPAGEIY